MYLPHLQGRKICERGNSVAAATCSCWFLTHGFFYPEDGRDTFLRNVGSQKVYMAPHPRRRHTSSNLQLPSTYKNLLQIHTGFLPLMLLLSNS
jgi:hypothetical protein